MNYGFLRDVSKKLGSQAIILSLPILKYKNSIFIYNFVNKNKIHLKTYVSKP